MEIGLGAYGGKEELLDTILGISYWSGGTMVVITDGVHMTTSGPLLWPLNSEVSKVGKEGQEGIG